MHLERLGLEHASFIQPYKAASKLTLTFCDAFGSYIIPASGTVTELYLFLEVWQVIAILVCTIFW